ncbi:MAG: hypothetical protein ACKV22_31075 [Bryobacteraceae bacterium]
MRAVLVRITSIDSRYPLVEWLLPTHYHDDHLAGYPALRARYGTKVVSSPELKAILFTVENCGGRWLRTAGVNPRVLSEPRPSGSGGSSPVNMHRHRSLTLAAQKASWRRIAHCEIDVRFPARFSTHSVPVLADVTWNGRHLGEIAEAIAYW